jgi:hypothetical protein
MDALLQKEFLRRGFTVSAGPDAGITSSNAELLVRYADDWRWDVKMYLRSYDLMVFDLRTNTLLATGSWKNSAMHGFYDEDKVVSDMVEQTLSKITAE